MERRSPWRYLRDEWVFHAVLSFLEDGGDDLHCLWLFAIDERLHGLRSRLEEHFTLSLKHAHRLAMLHSWWSILRKLGDGSSGVRFPPLRPSQRLSEATVDRITQELDRTGVPTHPDRREALLTAVRLDHKAGARLTDTCFKCDQPHPHACSTLAVYCSQAGSREKLHFCSGSLACVMHAAAHTGRLESVVWLHYVACYNQETALGVAAKNRHIDVVSWLLNHPHAGTTVDMKLGDEDNTLDMMAWSTCNNFPRCFTLMQNGQFFASASGSYAPECAAAKAGDVNTVARLLAHPFFGDNFTSAVANGAALAGQLPVLQFLYENCPKLFDKFSSFKLVVQRGYLEMAQWLVANSLATVGVSNVSNAVESGQVAMLQWTLESIRDGMSEEDLSSMARRAALGTSFEVMRWLVSEHSVVLSAQSHVGAAVRRRDTELAKWIVEHCQAAGTFSPSDALRVLEAAIEMENVELVQWLIEERGVWSIHAFEIACENHSVEVVSYIYERALERSPSSNDFLPCVYSKALERSIPSDIYSAYVYARALERPLARDTFVERLCITPKWINVFVWLVHHGLAARFIQPNALCGVMAIEATYAQQKRYLRSSTTVSPTETLATLLYRLRNAICFMAETYDAEYVRQIQWLPKWAAHHGKLGVLQRLAKIVPHDKLFTRRLFDGVLHEAGSEQVVQWFLEQAPTLFTTRAIQWAVVHGKHTLLKWLFATFLPVVAQRHDDEELSRKWISVATQTAVRYGRQHLLSDFELWKTEA